MIPRSFLLMNFICLSLFGQAPIEYPKDYFRSPMDIDLRLSGNFGEIRSNHFHSGIDIKTNSQEGFKIYAVADGYVSRIKVSPWGYGKALYITHPNGFVSVYAHLLDYGDSIEKYVRKEQYRAQSFEIERFPKKGEIPVKKGTVIAHSGNTGSSGGPHLHFEIRDEKSEHPINPLLFGMPVSDNTRPTLNRLYLYHFPDTIFQESVCDKNTLPQKYDLIKVNDSEYRIKNNPTLKLSKNAGFGIDAFDTQSGTSNKNGIYSIELFLDDEQIYYHEMDRFSFDESRYINSHIDYFEQKKNHKNIVQSFVARNNKLNIYNHVKDNGIINLSDSAIHQVKYLLKDHSGNSATLLFNVTKDLNIKETVPSECVAVYNCKTANRFETPHVKIFFPEDAFYEDLRFNYKMSTDTFKNCLSPTHTVHDELFPVHAKYDLSIKTGSLAPELQKKALIVRLYNGKIISEGGMYENDYVKTETKYFGNFSVMIDTVPPTIKPINIYPNKNMADSKTIAIKVGDNLSGVDLYRATIDGNWVLMEYEPKQALLFYTFDKSISKGKHTFSLEVRDERKNSSTYNATFVR